MKKDITQLFCFVDDFCNAVDNWLKEKSIPGPIKKTHTRIPELRVSEITTIILLYHQSPCKNFKYFYNSYLQLYKEDFPNLLSYNRFIELKKRVLIYLVVLLEWYCIRARMTGISYVDSTPISVCHIKRMKRNKVLSSIAALGKTTKGWFYGLKLHLVINEGGEIQGIKVTKGNTNDRVPVPQITKLLSGLLFGDKGYIKQELFQELYDRGLKLVTGIKKGMKNRVVPMFEKILLRKRSIIETVFDMLKCKFELEHTRHRSVWNVLVHITSLLLLTA